MDETGDSSVQMLQFLKNAAVAGGVLALYVAGPSRLSFDGIDAESDRGRATNKKQRSGPRTV